MADFAYNELKMRNVAVLAHVDAWAEIISKSFKDRFVKNGGKIVYDDTVQIGTNDFRLHISKIKNTKPDGVYFPIIPFDSVSFIKQAKENGLNVKLMTGDALIQDVIDATGQASEGAYFTNGYGENADLPNLYETKYERKPGSIIYVAAGFDTMDKIGKYLPSQNIKETFDKMFGPTRSADRTEKLYQIKNGVPVEIK